MKKITQKILLFAIFGLLALSMNGQITYYNDFNSETESRGFTVQRVSLGGQNSADVGARVSDIPDGADSNPVFSETRSTLTIPDGVTRAQRAISFKNVSGTSPNLVNHEIEAWALMTNQNLSAVNEPKVSFWTQQRFMIGSGSTLTVWVSENYTHGTAPSTATWTNETANISGAIATSGVSPLTYVYGELDLSAYKSASVTVAFKIVTDNSAYASGVSQHGTFYISDVKFQGTLNVMPGNFSPLNTSATGQASIFKTPTAAIDVNNFSNTSFSNIFTTSTSTPAFKQFVAMPAGEGYKFEVSGNYEPIVVTEVFYKLIDADRFRNNVDPLVGSKWIVQGSNDDNSWDDLSQPRTMTTANSGDTPIEYTEYYIPLTTSKAYRYYRFVLTEGFTSNSANTSLREINFKVAALWQGTSNADWSTGTNWNTAVVPTNEVVIPAGLTNFPTIPTGTTVTTNNITIESGATLVTQGTSTVSGNVTYRRNITHTSGNLEGWHLIGAPVTGQAYNATYVTANSIASSGTNRGIATYNNAVASGNWTYLQSAGSGTFTKGTGYSVKTSTTRDISFSGSLHTSDPELVGITVGAGTPFNLISNPFAAFVNAKTFLDATSNADKLTSKTIWVWNPATKNYETKLAGDPQEFLIAPGQGFFVSCSTAGNLEFAKSNQVHSGTETFLKSASIPEIVLKMTADTDERFAKIRYQNEATTSFDNGYDGETFSGVANSLDVFTQLIENTTDKKYQIQAIPNSNYENMVVPVGVFSSSSKEVTLTVDANNIPDGYHVYLEDRTNNVVTLLSDANTSYKTTVESGDSLGRFFIHMKTSSVLSSETTELTGITIYKSNTDLKIIGLNDGNATVSIYTVLGKKVVSTSFKATSNNSIKLPNLAKGIYVVSLQTENNELNKKIIIE